MPGLMKEQLEYIVVVSGSGRIVDARTDKSESARKHREKLERREIRRKKADIKKERLRILRVIREAKARLMVLMAKQNKFRKDGNIARGCSVATCTELYMSAAALSSEIMGVQKHIKEQQNKLKVL